MCILAFLQPIFVQCVMQCLESVVTLRQICIYICTLASIQSVPRSVRSGSTHVSGTFPYFDNVWLLQVYSKFKIVLYFLI